MNKLVAIRIKYDDETYSDEIPIGALVENVQWDNLHSLVDILGNVDVDTSGSIQTQIDQLFNDKVSTNDLSTYVNSTMKTEVSSWLNTYISPATGTIAYDASLSVEGAAADAKAAGQIVKISTTKPTQENNRIWVGASEEEYEVPTMNEFNQLKASLKSQIETLDDDNYVIQTEMTRASSTADYYMDESGENVRDVNYIVDKFAVVAGERLKIEAQKESPCVWCFRSGVGFSSDVIGTVEIDGGVFYVETPQNATYLFVSRLKTFTIHVYSIVSRIEKNAEDIEDNAKVITSTIQFLEDSSAMPIPIKFEIGNIYISENGWSYANRNSRIRTPEGYTISLKKGDLIVLNDNTNYKYYLGWHLPDDSYGSSGWLQRNYIVNHDAEFVVIVVGIPESEITDVTELSPYLSIYRSLENVPQHLIDLQDGKILSVKSINHRGFNTIAPENTLPAFKLSKINGFNYVECDVSLTSDGVPVILHDDTINRTARNADGTEISQTINITDITYEQALQYDFGIWKGSQYSGTKIPTLVEFCELCHKAGLYAYIEIKNSALFTQESIENLLDIVEKCGMKNSVTWISFKPAYLRYVVNANPLARIGYVYGGNVTEELVLRAKGFCTGKNEAFIDLSAYDVTAEQCAMCAAFGVPVEAWMSSDDYDTILGLPTFVTGITSNRYIAGKEIYENAMT